MSALWVVRQALPDLASHWPAATACPAHHHCQQQHVLVNGPSPLAGARDGKRGVFEMLWASQTRAAAAQMETKASESVKFSDLSDAQDLCLTLSKPFNGEDITVSCFYLNALLSIYPVTVAWAFLHLV